MMDIHSEMNSQEWAKNIGKANLADLYKVDKFLKDDIFISVVEYYMVAKLRKDDVPGWLHEQVKENRYRCSQFFDNNGQTSIRIRDRYFNSVVDAYSFIKNSTRIESAASLGLPMNIKYESVFGDSEKKLYHDGDEISSRKDNLYEENIPNLIKTRDDKYYLDKTIYIRNISSDYIGAIVAYKSDNGIVVLPAHVEENVTEHRIPRYYLCIGRHNKLLRLINEDLIEMNENSLVVFFDNPILADLFQKKVHDSCLVSEKDVVATSFFGGYSNIDSVNFDRLYGRDVVLVPSISRESYLNMKEYAKKIEAMRIRSVSICLEPYILHEVNDCNANLNGKWEQYVVQNAVNFLLKDASLLVDRLKKLSLSINQFSVWCIKHDLVDNPGGDVDSSCLMNASEAIELHSASDYEQAKSFDNLISFDNFTLICGPSNAGKGMLLLTFLHSIAYKINTFGFKVKKPRKVLLVDGESGLKRLGERFCQLSEAYPYEDLYKNNFLFVSLRDTKKFPGDFFSESNMDYLIKLIKDNSVSVVALDNLFSICKESTISEKTVDKIVYFAKNMAAIGVASIFAHHTNKEGEVHGSQKLHNLMQNVIKITGIKSTAGDFFKDIDDKFKNIPGALINITYEKCKEYIELENTKAVFFLNKPMVDSKASKWINLSGSDDGDDEQEVEELATVTEACAGAAENNSESDNESNFDNRLNLNTQERHVFEFINENVKVKMKEIVEHAKCKGYRVKEILKSLEDKKFIRKEGSTSDRLYVVNI